MNWLLRLWRWWHGYAEPTPPTIWHVDRDGRVRTDRPDREVVLRARIRV